MIYFIVTVQVVSFQGPHTPPYMEEIITFKIASHGRRRLIETEALRHGRYYDIRIVDD
ncbi:DUF3888 domain-containing protein [Peribacillus sp. SIMBA_075]|uniref:DUF3888 domain-containing protein n=1 Tax=Peribacillus sp. SIMBA_075 TaxID=3085813 RepID=UPI0039792BBE